MISICCSLPKSDYQDLLPEQKERFGDQRQLLFPFNDNYNSRLCCLTENLTKMVLERQRKQKEPVGRLAFPLPRKHFMHATA
jgi:hypothetical protein